jgi:glycosyltransferase involved in cell wall biosynthesis
MNVSVIIITKDRPEYLTRAIKSVLSQSKLPLEIIIVDDCSKIRLANDILEEYYILSSKLGIKFDYHYLNCPKGANYARNKGSRISTGEILMFLDDDDCWMKDKIIIQSDIFSTNPCTGLVYSGKQFVSSKNLLKTTRLSKESNSNKSIWAKNYIGGTSSVAIRKNIFEKAGGFDENLSALQDYDLWLRISPITQCVWDGEYNLIYTVHEDKHQISKNITKKIESIKYIKKKYKDKIDQLSPKNKRLFFANCECYIARTALISEKYHLFLMYYLKYIFYLYI